MATKMYRNSQLNISERNRNLTGSVDFLSIFSLREGLIKDFLGQREVYPPV